MLKLNLLTLAMMLAMAGGTAHAQSTTTETAPMSTNSGTSMVGVPGCHFGEKIDGSTADDARQHLEAAGYTSVSGLKKSCDNNWHGHAMLNGVGTNVMVTPQGRVVQEGY
jgi:hypothetical protein